MQNDMIMMHQRCNELHEFLEQHTFFDLKCCIREIRNNICAQLNNSYNSCNSW